MFPQTLVFAHTHVFSNFPIVQMSQISSFAHPSLIPRSCERCKSGKMWCGSPLYTLKS